MKTLQRRFNNTELKNPNWSTYIIFAEAIRGQGFSRQTIHRWFSILVHKNDYDSKDKRAILRNLERLSNRPEEATKQG